MGSGLRGSPGGRFLSPAPNSPLPQPPPPCPCWPPGEVLVRRLLPALLPNLVAACAVLPVYAEQPPAQDTPPPAPAAQPGELPDPPPTPVAPPASERRSEVRVGDTVITGDEFSFDPATDQIIITGNPRAVRGGDEITATRMLVNQGTRQFTAEGNVVIRQDGQVFRTERATYSFETREGRVDRVRSRFGTYYTVTDELLLQPGPRYVGLRCFLSTCNKRHPHWGLHPRRLTIVPEERWVAEQVGVDLLGVRLVTIPRISRSLRPEDQDERPVYPSVGYDNRNGPFVYDDFNLIEGRPVRLDASVQINTLREPQGGLLVATPGRLQAVGSLYYRDSADNQRTRHLQVSRLPEVGVVWSNSEAARPGRFLANQVPGVRYPQYLAPSREWYISGQLSGGYFRQHRGDSTAKADSESKNGARITAQGQAVLPTVDLGFLHLNDLRLLARHNRYDTGEDYTLLGVGIGKRVRAGNWRFSLHRFDQVDIGRTPFLFDDVELTQEWRPRVAFASRQFTFSYQARVDAKDYRAYDQIITLSRVFHCLEPRLTYRVRRQQIGLELRISGLSGFRRERTGEPRTQQGSGEEEIQPTGREEPVPPGLRPY